ncbi:hypothetical protein [Salinarimonas chemoclinalis]|uniref:hypothetical protein n=1 Tax=Salinarimonas chemoclinalis TaxID=3241599 RepID=UPI003558F9A1
MDTIRIAATKLEGLRPLGGPGDRNHASLRDVIAARFGEEHALLLAEPVPKQDGTQIDWYVPGSRRAMPLQTLPEAERADVESRLATTRDEILAHADSVERTGPAGAALAKALRAAMVVPGPQSIYAVPVEGGGYRPVLVAWAYATDGETPRYAGDVIARTSPRTAASAAGTEASGAGPATPAPPAAIGPGTVVVVQRETPWAWLLWLLLALLVAAILWLLLRSCGFGPAPLAFLDFCRPVVQARAADDAETGRLVDLVRDLERQVAAHEADCRLRAAAVPPAPAPLIVQEEQEPTPPAEPTIENEIRDRARREGGQEGALEITLAWDGRPDLDLRVECPGGGAIAFNARTCPGAVLDVDMNAGGSRTSDTPVEHVSWPQGEPPTGTFRIVVTHFAPHGDTRAQVPFRVVVTDGGRTAMSVEGRVARGSRETFTYER